MRAILYPSEISGRVAAPPSKSMAHRALICAALAKGESRVLNLSASQDITATLAAMRLLGASAADMDAPECRRGAAAAYAHWSGERTVSGPGSLILKGTGGLPFAPVSGPVDCCESGSTLRFLIPLGAMCGAPVQFSGEGRLPRRPQTVYERLFREKGVAFSQSGTGVCVNGRLSAGRFCVDGGVSNQFISGLLFALPLLEGASTVCVRPPFESRSYVDLTTDAMQKFGVKVSVRARKDGSATYKVAAPQHYAAADMDVEGDYSQAAFLAVLGSTVGGITITGLPSGSHQGDRVILDILKQCGAKFERSGSHVTFHRSLLKAVEIDLADCPDLGPVLIALGCFCSGTTIIRNAGRLRIKECDRIAAMQEELAKMGGTVKADGDTLTIEGCALHKPTAPLNGHNDHRIVMAMAVAALAAGQPAVIEGANAVNKSWPDFFEVIKGLGAHVTN